MTSYPRHSRFCSGHLSHPSTRLLVPIIVCGLLVVLMHSQPRAAAETWFEIKSPNFTVWMTPDDGSARTLLWQLEQVRSALRALWVWAKVDLPKPVLVLAVRKENGIKALAPEYWERKGAVHPVSLWVSGADRHYMAMRTDTQGEDTDRLNPYTSTYFAYSSLILQSSFERRLPLWLERGLAGVCSNTIVREKEIRFGLVIPWHLRNLRQWGRLPVKQLIAVTRSSPEYTQGDRLDRFDAESWAFVHYLMFGDEGAHRPGINKLVELLRTGKAPDAAFAEAIGRPEELDHPLANYIDQSIYGFQRVRVDASVAREGVPARAIPASESAAGRAVYFVAMRRPVEARALIEEARQSNPNEPDAYLAEALLFDREGKRAEAKAAFAKATANGSSNAYAYYRSAVLNWPRPDDETLRQMDKDLSRAADLNPSFAAAHAALAEVRALQHQPLGSVMPLITKAVSLEPGDVWHRLTAARVLWDLEDLDGARKAAQLALALAETEQERDEAQKLLASIQRELSK